MSSALDESLAAVGERLRRSTVAVRVRGGGGSGVVWSPDGAIVTNAHVVPGRDAEVELADGRVLPATVERRDAARDLAVLRIAAGGLEPAERRDAADLRPGEIVVAVGHPLGVPNAVSTGIVRSRPGDFVRADVRLEPGNSGGPLADARGRVVGVNAMVAFGAIALAVPSEAVRRFADGVAGPRLGVRLAPVALGARRAAYAVVGVEPASAAERSGIIVGDVLLEEPSRLAGAASVALLRGGVARTVPIRRDAGAAAA